ncbi:SRPBCC family protein [Maribacter sp. 2-571]|uniref:SRPBCC family protein n=1 Tax=Maribacter sp. 2-571 TaxID=3417569 RepID=UPI003D33DAE7
MDLFKMSTSIFLLFLVPYSANAQKTVTVKVTNSIVLTEDEDEVWTAVSNLENLDRLVPEIIDKTAAVGNGKGAIVTLTLKADGNQVIEEITKLNNTKRIISYKMVRTPMPMTHYKATIAILRGDRNTFTLRFTAILKTDSKNRERMRTTIDGFQKTLLTNIKNKSYEK